MALFQGCNFSSRLLPFLSGSSHHPFDSGSASLFQELFLGGGREGGFHIRLFPTLCPINWNDYLIVSSSPLVQELLRWTAYVIGDWLKELLKGKHSTCPAGH